MPIGRVGRSLVGSQVCWEWRAGKNDWRTSMGRLEGLDDEGWATVIGRDGTRHRMPGRELLRPLDDECVICANEGLHEFSREHVHNGQE